ncbi:mannosyltransferase APTG1 isoform X2 [Solanum verrucosum]|uniref:mannosyltransferase APTG1 isoform X2 n=1 Tax=Solanum verrucosum TaxID=315347 RepID=UPI0020D04B67|nr:mannosyltransferase APTG1 isoform X2 [Solanum verrucosum]
MRQRKNLDVSSTDSKTNIPKSSKNNKFTHPLLKKVFFLCLFVRFVNAFLVQTYFNPDEHWQALEVAHRISFGYGHLTWEWEKGIRSYLHPVIFAGLYKILAFFHLDKPWFMLFAQLTNWFMFFCITRTLSNSLETVLTVVSLYYWPCIRPTASKISRGSRKWGLATAALACAIRPTSAITWIYIGLLELYLTRDKLKFVLLEVIPIGTLIMGLTFLVDRWMYGTWVLVPLNFLKFNFLSAGGDYYGTHVWHWYFTQGFTVMVFTFLPFSLAGIFKSKQWKLSGLIAWCLAIYSLLGHKEFRFVLPVLPIALMFSGYWLATIGWPDKSNGRGKRSPSSHDRCSGKLQLAVLFLAVSNIPMAFYMSMVHQRGTEDVMNYLSVEADSGKVKSVLFFTPCHATPYYSTLHRNLPMRFLDCTPSDEKGALDESDQFLVDPAGFATEFAKNWSIPSHIVLFDFQEKLLKDFLALHNFEEIKRFFHAHFKVDRELQASVAVYTLKGQ